MPSHRGKHACLLRHGLQLERVPEWCRNNRQLKFSGHVSFGAIWCQSVARCILLGPALAREVPARLWRRCPAVLSTRSPVHVTDQADGLDRQAGLPDAPRVCCGHPEVVRTMPSSWTPWAVFRGMPHLGHDVGGAARSCVTGAHSPSPPLRLLSGSPVNAQNMGRGTVFGGMRSACDRPRRVL